MAKSISKPKSEGVRLPDETPFLQFGCRLISLLTSMRGLSSKEVSRSEAIRRLVELGLRAEMIAYLRTVLYLCCLAITLACGIAALTITVAIVTNKLPDLQAWMAVVFFASRWHCLDGWSRSKLGLKANTR